MYRRSLYALCMLSFFGIVAFNKNKPTTETTALTFDNLIPKPVMVKADAGSFSLSNSTVITIAPGNPELLKIARYMVDVFKPAMGFALQIDSVTRTSNSIALGL